MATFARGYWLKKTHHTNTRLRNDLKQQSVQTAPGRITWTDPTESLRGIPAIGRNCPGHIAGTRPDMIGD